MHGMIRFVALLLVAAGNWVMLTLMLALVFKAGEGFWDGSPMPQWVLYASALAVVVLGALSASRLGEWVVRLFYPIRKLTRREAAKLEPAFERVRAAYAAQLGRRLDADLFLIDDPMPQAIALGRGTIAVTRGALDVAEESELAGVLAHESGHLHHKDSMVTLALIGMNGVTYLMATVMQYLLPWLVVAMLAAVVIKGLVFTWVALLIVAVPVLLVVAVFLNVGITWVVSLMLRLADRSIEYRADRFAGALGFGPGLVGFLERLAGMEAKTEHRFLVMYLQSHPPTALRIDRLEE